MNRKLVYEDCIDYAEKILRIHLKEYQKVMLRCFCEGKEVRVCRGGGRSFCADIFGKYVAHLYDKNDYETIPDVKIPYQELVRESMLNRELAEDIIRETPVEMFEREYKCN